MSGSPSLATRGNNSATAEILVPLRENGDKPPLFHIAAGYSDMRLFGHAAEGLEEGRPVYGLQPPGESVVKGVRAKSLDWLVSEYIKQIKSVQDNGPYYLSGYSGGGLLAAETAKTLIKAGDPVAFLAVMDPPLRVPPWLTLCYMSLFKLCNLTPTIDRIRWRIIRRSGNRLLRWVSDEGMGTHMALLRGAEVRSYPGRLIYIEPERSWVRALNLLARMRTSWLKVARDGTEIYWTPGAHHSMLLPGHVECVSAILRDCLVRSDAADSATRSGLPRDPGVADCARPT